MILLFLQDHPNFIHSRPHNTWLHLCRGDPIACGWLLCSAPWGEGGRAGDIPLLLPLLRAPWVNPSPKPEAPGAFQADSRWRKAESRPGGADRRAWLTICPMPKENHRCHLADIRLQSLKGNSLILLEAEKTGHGKANKEGPEGEKTHHQGSQHRRT